MPTVLPGDDIGLKAASLLLCYGRQVVIPTETVYGLAANALNYDAVAEIFRIKGRPATNPLIVHVRSLEHADTIVEINSRAEKLAAAFWPGPLTLVLNSIGAVPDNVTAGGNTVAIRQPSHPLTQQLLDYCNLPLAAPSANRSEGISPTTVDDVIQSLGENTPPILDGGDCVVGIESTVVDLTQPIVRILRHGAISLQQISDVLGEPVEEQAGQVIARSPGQMPRHYAPTTTAQLAESNSIEHLGRQDTGLLYYSDQINNINQYKAAIKLPGDPAGFAARLYASLHELDRADLQSIIIETPPATAEWAAVNDRLSRATTSA